MILVVNRNLEGQRLQDTPWAEGCQAQWAMEWKEAWKDGVVVELVPQVAVGVVDE